MPLNAPLTAHEHPTHTPVFILIPTDQPSAIETCDAVGCNSYVTKPVADEPCADAVGRLGWLPPVVQVPRGVEG